MTDDARKVRVEVDGIIYRGRRSVSQVGSRVLIDGKIVGVEVDNDGNPLTSTNAGGPSVSLSTARVVIRLSWWARLWQWLTKRSVGA